MFLFCSSVSYSYAQLLSSPPLEASWRSWSELIRLSTGLSASQASEKRVDLSSAAGNRGLFLWRSPDGRALLARALAAGVPCAWGATHSVYGGDYALRLWLEHQPSGYVLAVTSKPPPPV